jgi:hypothetical protein
VDNKYGYVFAQCYKPFYFPGELVRGSIILDLFADLPKNSKKVYIRFTGKEHLGKQFSKVLKAYKQWQKSVMNNSSWISKKSEASSHSVKSEADESMATFKNRPQAKSVSKI